MSRENVELVRSTFRPGDPSRFFDLLDEEVEIDFSADPPPDYSELIRGKAAAVDMFRHFWGPWDDFVLEPTEIIDADEGRVVTVFYARGRGKGSGVPFERRWVGVWTLRAGKVVRWQSFKTREEALKAAGLSE